MSSDRNDPSNSSPGSRNNASIYWMGQHHRPNHRIGTLPCHHQATRVAPVCGVHARNPAPCGERASIAVIRYRLTRYPWHTRAAVEVRRGSSARITESSYAALLLGFVGATVVDVDRSMVPGRLRPDGWGSAVNIGGCCCSRWAISLDFSFAVLYELKTALVFLHEIGG